MKTIFKNKMVDYLVISILLIGAALYNDIPAIKTKLISIEEKLDKKVNREEFNQFRTEYYEEKRDMVKSINNKIDKYDFKYMSTENYINYKKNNYEKNYKNLKEETTAANN